MSARLILVVAYDGTDLVGWQSQAADAGRTVQALLEGALRTIGASQSVVVEGAGRTDAGVHALAAVAHADVERVPDKPRRRLNGVLPDDVRVRGVALAPPDFHARKDARGKRYSYRFWCDAVAAPLERRTSWHADWRLDVAAMRRAAALFQGERDFASLQSSGSSVTTTRRELTRCELLGDPPELRLVVEGTGFLRHMVRTIAGCLLEVGRGRRDPSWIPLMLEQRRRAGSGPTAPAHGLVLEDVFYAEPIAGLLRRALAGEDPAREVTE